MAATYRRVNMKALARYQIILLGEQRHMGVNTEQLPCPRLLPDNAAAGIQTRDLSITSPTR